MSQHGGSDPLRKESQLVGVILGFVQALLMLGFVAVVILTLAFFMMLVFRFASEIGGS